MKNLKTLKKAIAIYEQIEKIDKKIKEINDFAVLASNSDIECNLSLSVKDLKAEKEKGQVVKFDSDGSIINNDSEDFGTRLNRRIEMVMWGIQSASSSGLPVLDKYTKRLDMPLNDITLLEMCGLILSKLNDERNEFLSQLKKHGIDETKKA